MIASSTISILIALHYRHKYYSEQHPQEFEIINPPKQVLSPIPKLEPYKSKKDVERERWLKIRSKILLRDNFRCKECGYYKHLEVHHIIPKSKGGSDDEENLVTLCQRCHAKKHGFAHQEHKRYTHAKRNRRKKQKRWYKDNAKKPYIPEFVIGPIEDVHHTKTRDTSESISRRKEFYEKWLRDELNQTNKKSQ